jgi:hypothetical protein
MKRIDWDAAIRSLVLVRLGQELGTDSPLARMVHDSINDCPVFPRDSWLM